MPLAAHLLSSTLGLVFPRYRTLGEWAETYRKIIAGKPIEDKTKANRLCILAHVLAGLGEDRIISAILPHEISGMVMGVHKAHPSLAKRILIEAKDFFNEAVNYAWILRSPAAAIRYPKVRVLRERLTLDQWKAIHAWSVANQPPWVSRMLVLALVTAQRRSDVEKFRFSDVWDDHLHVIQAKTGERLALPVDLRLDAIGVTIGQAIEDCRGYAINEDFLLRKHNGQPLVMASLSARFEEAREAALPPFQSGHPPSLHECRSLSERLYRAQRINTMILLGHKHQAMTDLYNDDRGLSQGSWKTLHI
ncbi:MAG: tyrosine-type recombinase/integrase [Azonexus sp.]